MKSISCMIVSVPIGFIYRMLLYNNLYYYKGGQIKIYGNPNMGYLNFSSGKGQFTHRRHDTTRHHATRPVFSLPIQSNGSVNTYAARPSLVVTTKSCWNKNRSGSDFCRVSQRQYQENC